MKQPAISRRGFLQSAGAGAAVTPENARDLNDAARVGAWQEGAALAAHWAVQMICDRVRSARVA